MYLSQVRSKSGPLVAARHKSDGTHVKDMKDPVEIQFPGGDGLLIVRRVDKSGDRVPSALFDDLPLDLCYSPAIKNVVRTSPKVFITGLAHVVNCAIASRTD